MDASVVVLPQWQGSVHPSARQLAAGAARLADLIRDLQVPVLDPGGFGHERSPLRNGVDSYDALLTARARIAAILPEGPLLAIGGDCGADLVPASRELQRRDKDLAILWIDAHADFNTPAISPSGAFHGMVLRSLTGLGPAGLVASVPARAASLVLAGTRAIDPGERRELISADVRPLGMDGMTDPGAVLRQLKATGCSAVHIHLDLDVLDPAVFPHTGYPAPGGATIGQVLTVLQAVDAAMPVSSAFVGEHIGAARPESAADSDAADAEAVAPLLRQLVTSLGRS